MWLGKNELSWGVIRSIAHPQHPIRSVMELVHWISRVSRFFESFVHHVTTAVWAGKRIDYELISLSNAVTSRDKRMNDSKDSKERWTNKFSFQLRLHRFSLWGCHVMNAWLKAEDLRDEQINYFSGSDCYRFSLRGCHMMNERLKPDDSKVELINYLSGSGCIRCVRLEAVLRRMISVWHQSIARAIRMHRILLLSYRSRGTLTFTLILVKCMGLSRDEQTTRKTGRVERWTNQFSSQLRLQRLLVWDFHVMNEQLKPNLLYKRWGELIID